MNEQNLSFNYLNYKIHLIKNEDNNINLSKNNILIISNSTIIDWNTINFSKISSIVIDETNSDKYIENLKNIFDNKKLMKKLWIIKEKGAFLLK